MKGKFTRELNQVKLSLQTNAEKLFFMKGPSVKRRKPSSGIDLIKESPNHPVRQSL
jgi:hypothetical protein